MKNNFLLSCAYSILLSSNIQASDEDRSNFIEAGIAQNQSTQTSDVFTPQQLENLESMMGLQEDLIKRLRSEGETLLNSFKENVEEKLKKDPKQTLALLVQYSGALTAMKRHMEDAQENYKNCLVCTRAFSKNSDLLAKLNELGETPFADVIGKLTAAIENCKGKLAEQD